MKTVMLLVLFAVLLIPIVTLTYTAATSTHATGSSPNQESPGTGSDKPDLHPGQSHDQYTRAEYSYFLRTEPQQ